jgi:hypothetical protein
MTDGNRVALYYQRQCQKSGRVSIWCCPQAKSTASVRSPKCSVTFAKESDVPQLDHKRIEVSDLIQYLDQESDFSFELTILKSLVQAGLECEHGGTYTDPATAKTREFDIRARAGTEPFCIWLPIECKNVRPYFPVLVSCVPRRADEAYHEIVFVGEPEPPNFAAFSVNALQPKGQSIRLEGERSMYPAGEMVGKATSQVGRASSKREIYSNDADIFDKWSQCLNSACDLAKRLDDNELLSNAGIRLCGLVPIVVVPEDMLWSVHYASEGARLTDPTRVTRIPMYIGKEYEVSRVPWLHYRASHLELVTPIGLQALIHETFPGRLFPELPSEE